MGCRAELPRRPRSHRRSNRRRPGSLLASLDPDAAGAKPQTRASPKSPVWDWRASEIPHLRSATMMTYRSIERHCSERHRSGVFSPCTPLHHVRRPVRLTCACARNGPNLRQQAGPGCIDPRRGRARVARTLRERDCASSMSNFTVCKAGCKAGRRSPSAPSWPTWSGRGQ